MSQAELDGFEERAASMENEIKAQEKKSLEFGGVRWGTQKSKVVGLHVQFSLANDESTIFKVAKAKAEKTLLS